MNNKRTAVCVRWGGHGYGFIQDLTDGVEYFAHISNVVGRVGLVPGTHVEFEPANFKSKSGAPVALAVKPMTGGAL
jgi:cold shock CspA family protein